jgi:hypothetical protein
MDVEQPTKISGEVGYSRRRGHIYLALILRATRQAGRPKAKDQDEIVKSKGFSFIECSFFLNIVAIYGTLRNSKNNFPHF